MQRPRRYKPGTQQLSDEWLWWKIKAYFRKKKYGSLCNIADRVFGYYNSNFRIKDILVQKARTGEVAIIGRASARRFFKVYCLAKDKEYARRKFLPEESTRRDVLDILADGPKCTVVIENQAPHRKVLREMVLPLMRKSREVVRAQVGTKYVYALSRDSDLLEEMKLGHVTSRLDRICRLVLKMVRRYPGISASSLVHLTSNCRCGILGTALRHLVGSGKLRLEIRGHHQCRYYVAHPKHCRLCGQALQE